jgi:hypothetical protein
MKKLIETLLLSALPLLGWSQAGISVSPGRLYYQLESGASGSEFVNITNPNEETLEVGVSFSDWNYEVSGANQIAESKSLYTSCVDWVQVLPSSYFIIQPKETKKIEVILKVPPQANTAIPVHNAMVFFTQLNPSKIENAEGASIQVTVRMGVKIYHSFVKNVKPQIEIIDLKNYIDSQKNKIIKLTIANKGTIWADGKLKWELFNTSTGEKKVLNETDFFTLPKDVRELNQALPQNLTKGKYTVFAQIMYGDIEVIKIAELDFEI